MKKRFAIALTMIVLNTLAIPSFAGEMEIPVIEGSPALQAMKSLAGTWKGTHTMQGKEVPATVTYKVTSNGSSVVETLFPDTPQEMITVYHDKSGKLSMTHYCSVGNQPQLDLVNMEGRNLSFSLAPDHNPGLEHEGHMHDLTITIQDTNHVKHDWTYYDKDKPQGHTSFTLVRVQ